MNWQQFHGFESHPLRINNKKIGIKLTNKKKLVIVESPTKAKTIAKLLGEEFNSIATVGHFRDLSKKDLGIEIKETEKTGAILKK